MKFYYRSWKVNEPTKKSRSYNETVVDEATVRRVLNLVQQGYSYRRIEEETGIKKGRVFKIVNGMYRLEKVARCSECGRKLTKAIGVCQECRLRMKYGEQTEKDPPKEEEEDCLKLDLRPKEYERYLVVRQRKLEQLEREARERAKEEERRRRLDDY